MKQSSPTVTSSQTKQWDWTRVLAPMEAFFWISTNLTMWSFDSDISYRPSLIVVARDAADLDKSVRELAAENKLDPVVGRDNEITRIFLILDLFSMAVKIYKLMCLPFPGTL